MRINHNISALNAWRSMSETQYTMGKTLEKLSSGLRINRAGDDAAGLAISEKMRGQIRGLDMAVKNAQDAISLIQTAEGALTEVHSILQRMRELAVQAASDTNTNVDRYQVQAELDQLREEIDRIARTTEFNTMKLLDGKIESFRPQADVKVVTGGNLNLQVSQSNTAYGVVVANTLTTLRNGESQNIEMQLGNITASVNVRVTAYSTNIDGKTQTVNIGGDATITVNTLGFNFGAYTIRLIDSTVNSVGAFTIRLVSGGVSQNFALTLTDGSTNALRSITWNGLRFDFRISDISASATIEAQITSFSVSLASSEIVGVNILSGTNSAGTVYGVVSDSATDVALTTTIGELSFQFTFNDVETVSNDVNPELNNVQISITGGLSTLNFPDAFEGSYVVEVGQFFGSGTSELDVRINYFNDTGLVTQIITPFSSGKALYGTISGDIQYQAGSGFAVNLYGGIKGTFFTWSTGVYNINSFGGALPDEEVVDSGVVRAEERWYQDTSLVFQIGANEGHNMVAGLDDMRAAALGLTPQSLQVTDQNVAERTVMVIDAAIHKVSSARAKLGAVQNRLEHTISNLGVAAENLTAAESRIRDADMAKEMMAFTKQQILMQSSMAMLAQANT